MKVYLLTSVLVSAFLLGACAQTKKAGGSGRGVFSHRTFASAQEAADALGAAYLRRDQKAIAEILGDQGYQLISSGDAVIDQTEADWFCSLYREAHQVELQGDSQAVLNLGRSEQPYPIPLVKVDEKWRFDPSEGHEDLLSRRISKAELSAVNLVMAYVTAQREYKAKNWSDGGQHEYAQRLASHPGKHDGLFWETTPGKGAGPLGELAETAYQEGYRLKREGEPVVYRGYVYKLLMSQGPKAPGGAGDYLVGGRLVNGFALVAFPTRYAVSGVLTFLVNQEGIVYQKDLGPQTSQLGQAMTQFNPDRSWTKGAGN
jgi:hypothetical protein